ncbi:hypothetical protein [Nocardia sp. CDC160]|uniref:hypothetical protein n=1 Tax=Nocardia sp. CDC160 TaxID=3112166 RepID=UPI002DB9EA6E|nr:hypothetical protein [Nocardia sp. CDC160]MEC3917903.1 hypothetical protein [Nocardia sp. CDC160]
MTKFDTSTALDDGDLPAAQPISPEEGMITTALRRAAIIETLSLVVLLLNLITVHWPMVSTLIGPVHGCAYIVVIMLAFRLPETRPGVKALALLPVVGGLLVLRGLAGRRSDTNEYRAAWKLVWSRASADERGQY